MSNVAQPRNMSTIRSLLLFAFVFVASSLADPIVQLTPVIQTKYGPVQGKIDSTVWNSIQYSAFKGIPFAEPPLTSLRFQPPRPPKSWSSTLKVIDDPAPCPQMDVFKQKYIGDEDCLYLNVYTPETQFGVNMTLKPVMAWIYGGSFITGSCSQDVYGPDFIIEEDVVMVCLQYRLGALGYLYLDHPQVLGNAGMKDQALALRWIQENIKAFGGDPDKVTLFGQSAGSASVGLHGLSDMSKDLFHQSIKMSGSANSYLYQAPEDALKSAEKLASAFGVVTASKEELLEFYLVAPAEDLVTKTEKLSAEPANSSLPFRPTKENVLLAPAEDLFLTECPVSLYYRGEIKQQPIILGFTENEILSFTESAIRIINGSLKIEKAVLPSMPITREELYKLVSVSTLIISDYEFKAYIDLEQRLLAAIEDFPVYYYVFDYRSIYGFHEKFGIPIAESGHEDDVAVIFNLQDFGLPTDKNDEFNQFRKKMVGLWTNFAKYGNPTPPDSEVTAGIVWEDSRIAGKQMNISVSMQMEDRTVSPECVTYSKILYYTMPLTSGCTKDPLPLNYTKLF